MRGFFLHPGISVILWETDEKKERNLPVFLFPIIPLTSHYDSSRRNKPPKLSLNFYCLLKALNKPEFIPLSLSLRVSFYIQRVLHELQKRELKMSDNDDLAKGRIFNSSDVIFLNS